MIVATTTLAGTIAGGGTTAVMTVDEDVVDGAQGREAGADDADGVFDDGPDDGVDVGPWTF